MLQRKRPIDRAGMSVLARKYEFAFSKSGYSPENKHGENATGGYPPTEVGACAAKRPPKNG
jgi:hypothetical protein